MCRYLNPGPQLPRSGAIAHRQKQPVRVRGWAPLEVEYARQTSKGFDRHHGAWEGRAEIEAEFLRMMRGKQEFFTSFSILPPNEIGARRVLKGRWYVTPHAVDQYRKRIHKCSRNEALAELISISQRARFVKMAYGDCEMWRSRGRLRLRLIVGPGDGELPALVTVLGEHDDATGKYA